MTFDETLARVLEALQRKGRVSYRALRRRFDLDEEYLEDLKAEIIQAKKLAVDEDGAVLVWTRDTTPPSVPMPTPERVPLAYTPRHLAEKILTSRAALIGERKQVTVLFCDLANSTALAERLGPEAMHTLLHHFFELALREVHRYEGTVQSISRRWFYGTVWGAGSPRGPCQAGRPGRPGTPEEPARRERPVPARTPARRGALRPHGPQYWPGGGRQHRGQSAHGLHRGGGHDQPGRQAPASG
jgi:hypothetical protein